MALVLEYPYVIESLRKFEKEFMDVWSGKGYSPESGAFWSIIKKDAPVLLKFSRFDESDPGFILTLSDNRDRFERTNMSNWFNRLKEEYQKSK
jgi:hypothetical protein